MSIVAISVRVSPGRGLNATYTVLAYNVVTTIVGMNMWVTSLVRCRMGVPAVRVCVIRVTTRESIALLLACAIPTIIPFRRTTAVFARGLLMLCWVRMDLLATTDLLMSVLLVNMMLLSGTCLLVWTISRLLAPMWLTLTLRDRVGLSYLLLDVPLVVRLPVSGALILRTRVICGCSPTSDRMVPLAFLWVPVLNRCLIRMSATIMLIDLKQGLSDFLGTSLEMKYKVTSHRHVVAAFNVINEPTLGE